LVAQALNTKNAEATATRMMEPLRQRGAIL
jgi:hypothetical protein